MAESERKTHASSLVVLAWICLVGCFLPSVSTNNFDTFCQPEHTSCGPLCIDRVSFSRFGQDLSRRVNCRCDRKCSLYGDCCSDYWDHCVNDTHPPISSSRFSPFFECITTTTEETNPYSSFNAVGRCPPDWPQDSVRQNCENDTLAQSQKLLLIPVNGPDEIVFKNVYCTICHRVPETQIQAWSFSVWDCETDWSYIPEFDTPFTPDFDTCMEYGAKSPPSTSDPHLCYQDYVDSCPPTATETQSTLCENHTVIVFQVSGFSSLVSYRNVHCADCNNNHSTDYEDFRCHLLGGLIRPPRVQSFILLFDFKQRVVSVTDDRSSFPPEILGNCNHGQIYDPFLDDCKNLTSCSTGMGLHTGQCDESHHRSKSDLSSHGNSTSACLQLLLSSDEIAKFSGENFTALVEFSVVEGSTLNARDADWVYIDADFSIAGLIREALDNFIVNTENIGFGTYHPCNATTLALVALSQDVTNKSRGPVCEGFTLPHVQLNATGFQNGVHYISLNGLTYTESEFMHVTLFDLAGGDAGNSTSKVMYLRLCSPFADRCPVVAFDKNEFLRLDSDDNDFFVHKVSGMAVPSDDIWQLPDGTLRMCSFPLRPNPVWLKPLSDLSIAGSVCSLVTLLQTLITYFLFPVLRNQPGKIIMNLIVALILSQVLLFIDKISIPWLCALRAAVLHFTWLAVFAWMSVLAGDLAYRLKSNLLPSQVELSGWRFVKLSALGWGLPALFVSVCYSVSRLAQGQSWGWLEYGGSSCWIVDTLHSFYAFGIPVAVLLFVNCVLDAFIIYMVISNNRRLAALQMASNAKNELLMCSKLVVITGIFWSLFFAANLVDSAALWYVSALVNSFQGTLIGLMFLLKKNIRGLWRQKLREWFRGFLRGGRRQEVSGSPVVYNIPMADEAEGQSVGGDVRSGKLPEDESGDSSNLQPPSVREDDKGV